MIRIASVEFENYRQYKSIRIDFRAGQEYDLHILRAKNGTGKTTFLNGILWCLYGKEYYINDNETALPVVNSALIQQSKEKDSIRATVRLTLNDHSEIILFERTQVFRVVRDPISYRKTVSQSDSKLKVVKTSSVNSTNSIVIEDEIEVQSIVKQYFDEAIHDYYFFDGENLKSFFTKGKSEKIKSSIFNIAQVTLLRNASSHIKGMADEYSRKARTIAGGNAGIDDFTFVIAKLENEIEKLEAENREIEEQQPVLKKEIDKADIALQEYAPIRQSISRRAELERDLQSLESDYDAFIAEKNSFIVNYLTWLHFYPRVKAAYDLIIQKQESGTLPPSIDKDQIKSILDNHVKNCPVCNGELDSRAIRHLQMLLDQLDVSSSTSNFLMEIKGGLESIIEKCKRFPEKYQKLISDDKFYTDSIREKQEGLKDISAFLSRYSDENGSFDVKKVEEDRKRALRQRELNIQRLASNKSLIEIKKETLEEKKAERQRAETRSKEVNLYTKQVNVLRKLYSQYEVVQSQITDEIKEDIQLQTWERFSSMIWKKNTFGSISINDLYELSVFNLSGNEMTGSLSATEYMALAYSFTLAIHDASGKNCPLVVDSPLGRVSDDNRTNMATELLKVSAKKQIIMLFTPDEYSAEVKRVYDNSAASIRDISLSASEDQIAGVK